MVEKSPRQEREKVKLSFSVLVDSDQAKELARERRSFSPLERIQIDINLAHVRTEKVLRLSHFSQSRSVHYYLLMPLNKC